MCEIMIDSNKPKSQTGSCVGPTVPRLRGDIVDCPAPEVWTDGFGGVHRKVFGESVALMFTASWLNHWGACWQDQRKWGHSKSKIACVCVSLCVDDVKGEMVSSSVFSFFCSVCHVLAVEHQATIIKKSNYGLSDWAHHWKCLQPTKWVLVQMEWVTQH